MPVLRGVIRNPTTLFADRGEWSDYPDYVHHTWERCAADVGSCEDLGYNSATYRVTAADAGYRLRVASNGENELGYSETVYSEPSPVIPAPDEDPPGGGEDPPDPPGGDDDPPDPPVGGDDPPVANDAPADPALPLADDGAAGSPVLSSGSAFVPLAAAQVRVLSARAGAARYVVLRLSATGAVRSRIELRRRGREIAAMVADLRAGTNAVRLRLPRGEWRTLVRRGALSVTVVTGNGPQRTLRMRR